MHVQIEQQLDPLARGLSIHADIEQQLSTLAGDANRGSGLSYHWYCQRFTWDVDHFVRTQPVAMRPQIIEAAKAFGYGDEDRSEGDCMHGIDPNCCPAGCGDNPIYYRYDIHESETASTLSVEEEHALIHTLEAHLVLLEFVDQIRGLNAIGSARLSHLQMIYELIQQLCEDGREMTTYVVFGRSLSLYELRESIDGMLMCEEDRFDSTATLLH